LIQLISKNYEQDYSPDTDKLKNVIDELKVLTGLPRIKKDLQKKVDENKK